MMNEHMGMRQEAMTYNKGMQTRQICWAAILAGALVAVGLGFLLNLFSMGLGLSAFTTNPDGMRTLALGGLVGLLIGGAVSMFASGWVAGFYTHSHHCRSSGIVHGFVAWCVALVISLAIVSTPGTIFASGSQLLINNNLPEQSVQVTNNEAAPAVTEHRDSSVTVNPTRAANNLGMGAFILFLIFFTGAVFSCLGGHMAWHAKEKCQAKGRD